MHWTLPAFVVTVFLMPLSAAAQDPNDDPMEEQRCVWRCLAEYGHANWSGYEACVARNCSAGGAPAAEPEPVAPLSQPRSPLLDPAPGTGGAGMVIRPTPSQGGQPLRRAEPTRPRIEPQVPQGGPVAGPGQRRFTVTSAPAGDGRWRYGDHPVLGWSAHIDTADGAIGLACGDTGGGAPFVVRTSGDLASEQKVLMFENRAEAFNILPVPGQQLAEHRGDSCQTAIEAFRDARELFVVSGRLTELFAEGGDYMSTIVQGEQRIDLNDPRHASHLRGSRVVPLRGSSAAIGQLFDACPAARLDYRTACPLEPNLMP